MNATSNDTDNQWLIRQYLLGQLEEREQQRAEQQVMTDADFHRQVALVEDDLTDEYASGLLTETERKEFEKRFLPVARRRRQVQVARLLTGRASNCRTADLGLHRVLGGPKKTWSVRVGEVGRAMTFPLLLILALAVVGLFLKTRELSEQLQEARSSSPASSQGEEHRREIIELQRQVSELARQLEGSQTSRPDSEKSRTGAKSTATVEQQHSKLNVLALLISPGMLRSSGQQQNSITLASGIDRVQLNLKLEAEPQRIYRASVRSDEGKPVWQQNHLKTFRQQGAEELVIVTVPAGSLPTGDYTVRLEGAKHTGTYTRLGTYYFKVVRE